MSQPEFYTFADTHPEIVFAAIGVVAIIVALLVSQIGLIAMRRAAKGYSFPTIVIDNIRQPTRWLLCFVVLQVASNAIPGEIKYLDSLQHILLLGIICAVSWLGVRLAKGTSIAVLDRYSQEEVQTVHARRVQTQARLLARTIMTVIAIIGFSAALMTFPTVRQLGTSLLASAGLAGVVVGLAARPIFSNLLAGLQIALTQPIRINDVVIVEGEWGVIEQILSTYVVVKIWDDRRMVMPLQWFIDKPFQNWTLSSADLTGTIYFWVDYRTPLEPLRAEFKRLCDSAPEWDRRFQVLQVTDVSENAMQLRALVTAADAAKNWDLRCRIREGLLTFLQHEYPACLPQSRTSLVNIGEQQISFARTEPPNERSKETQAQKRVAM